MIGARIQLKNRPLTGQGLILREHPTQDETWLVEFDQGYKLWLREADFVVSQELHEDED